MDETISLLEFLNEPLKIDKPIRLIELFAGYGSQALALKYLGVNFEHWRIAEWCYKSIDAYNKLHFGDTTDYSKDKDKDWLIYYLAAKNISADWNKPMTYDQIKRMPEHQIRKIYNDIQATHNLVDISQITANDLDISDNHYCYILTYSFPCQDLSLAGNTAGMNRESGTRSSLLWEVERLLKECDKKPDILLMENVTQVHNDKNMPNFREWMQSLEKMGYENYWQDMIGTDYGMPQIRNRTFMVSVLGEKFYNFPKPIPLEKKLKDALELNADEKYFLSDKGINYVLNEKRPDSKYTNINPDEAITVTAKGQNNWTGSFISEQESIIVKNAGREIVRPTAIATTRLSRDYKGLPNYESTAVVVKNLLIKNATKQGYLEAEDGDGVDISTRMEHHRGTVQKGKSQTISTMGGENQGVVVKKN